MSLGPFAHDGGEKKKNLNFARWTKIQVFIFRRFCTQIVKSL